MIQTRFGHLQFNVHPQNLAFYKELFPFAGWPLLAEGPGMLAFGHGVRGSLWFFGKASDAHNDYDGPGINHLALQVENQHDVDETVAYLQERNIACLFDTPRHRPEFCASPEETYYQVMFASPDRILLEVVYIGPVTRA
ncbi:MAG: VOC family protein [Chloroflexota bacterium]